MVYTKKSIIFCDYEKTKQLIKYIAEQRIPQLQGNQFLTEIYKIPKKSKATI